MNNNNDIAPQGGEIIIFQTPDGLTKLDVQMQEETVWLTQQQMALLFEKDRTVIVRHINNIYKEQELDPKSARLCRLARPRTDGAARAETELALAMPSRDRGRRQSTCAFFAQVQMESRRVVERKMPFYTLDRFLRINDDVYLVGASIKDLGKNWFGFSRMYDITPDELIAKINNK